MEDSMCRSILLAILALFWLHPSADAQTKVVRSAQNGPWSASTTWEGGKVPAAGDKIQVRAGHTVVYDVQSDAVFRSLFVVGTLTFAPDRDTRLDVGLIKIEASDSVVEEGFDCDSHIKPSDPKAVRAALLVGTPEQPIDSKYKALIRLH
jgi:hypothetical protein